MSKLTPVGRNGEVVGYYFDCPGCKAGHFVKIKPYQLENGASWTFNGDFDQPTFTPSINDRWDFSPGSGKAPIICHSIITNGKIQFLGDCTHSKAGQTVDMLDVEDTSTQEYSTDEF